MSIVPPDPTELTEPVWFEPLRSPTWLMPEPAVAPLHVRFVPGPVPGSLTGPDRQVRLGLPMALAEAVRFTTDVASVSALRPGPADLLATVIVDEPGEGRAVRVVMTRGDGAEAAVIARGSERADEAGELFAALPGLVAGTLRDLGAKAQWSTIYRAPAPVAAIGYARAHRVVGWLRDPAVHEVGEDPQEAGRIRATIKDALAVLADTAGRAGSPFATLLFLAGLFATRDGGSGVHTEFRLAANAICVQAKDPHDPLYRVSVPVLAMIGEARESERRRELVARDADLEVRRWLLRTAL
jgi:hypothetical protein